MLDKTLAGSPGRTVAERARDGYTIPGSQRVDTPVVNGRDVKLTIDADLQWYAQNALAKQVTGVGAESGTAVVIEVATGKIRAAASYPTYDSNDPGAAKTNLANRAFWDAFEPGSTGKLMTMAAAMEQKVVTPDTGVIVPMRLPRAGIRFKDNEAHGVEHMTATGVIAKSSNMGTMLIGERVPPADDGGLLPEVRHRPEDPGQLPRGVERPARPGRELERPTALHRPLRPGLLPHGGPGDQRVPDRRQQGHPGAPVARRGHRTTRAAPLVPAASPTRTRVVSQDTAVKLLADDGGGDRPRRHRQRRARIKGYRVAGKTGTADRYDDGLKAATTASPRPSSATRRPRTRSTSSASSSTSPARACSVACPAGPVFNQVMTYLLERTAPRPARSRTSTTTSGPRSLCPTNDPDVISNARAKRDGL